MSNVKTVKTSNYVQLHNKAGLDKELSAKAKGILFTAMTLPPEYEINKTTFHHFFKDGRDSIKGGIEELILKGYGFHEQMNIGGKFDAITLISDVKLTTLAKLDRDELETFVAEISDELLYALDRIRESGTTHIGKLHNEATKEKRKQKASVTENQSQDSVTENQSREFRHEKSVRNKEVELKKVFKDLEEEEDTITVVTEADVINLVNIKIQEREITNENTVKAIFDVALKCKAIGTDNKEAAENYVIKVVEEKMTKFGKNQRVKKSKGNSNNKPVRTEIIPEHMDKEYVQTDSPKEIERNKKKMDDILAKLRA